MADVKHTLATAPLWGFLTLPRGRLLKVHADPCMYAPGYLQSNKPRWPGEACSKPIGGAARATEGSAT